MPKVTICVPVYNCEDTIDACLNSVLLQTYDDFECLVVDNASTDSTFDRVAAHTDPRIRVVRNPRNIGPNPNHDRCIALAVGDLIQFLHSDDRLLPDCLKRLVPTFDDPGVGLAFARRRIEPAGTEWAIKYAELHTPIEPVAPVNDGMAIVRRYVDQGSSGNWIGEPSSVMIRRSVLTEVGGFNPEMKYSDDMELWLRILARSDAAWVDDELSVRTHDQATLTAHYEGRDEAWLDRLWVVSGLARNRDLETSIRAKAAWQWGVAVLKKCVRAQQAPSGIRRVKYGQLGRHIRRSLSPRPARVAGQPELSSGRYLHTR